MAQALSYEQRARRVLVLVAVAAFLAVAFPLSATAAAPQNDNRASAELLPTFPAATHGTTVEATTERLDPQVSECGRIEATVWYRINSAPDGRVVVTVKGSSTLAPVVRIYRRKSSSIQEIDCGTAPAAGTVVTSFETVRGAGYFVLVGRRPDATDGEFDLRADLYLPPTNDRRGDAQAVRTLPSTIKASTLGATGDDSDRGACGLAGGTVWYSVPAPAGRRVVLRLTAAGELDGAVAVFERVRSQLDFVGCAPTDRKGHAVLAVEAPFAATYLVVVGQRRSSDPGDFRLRILLAERPEGLPGHALPRGGVHGSLHGLTDVNDVWWLRMRAGTTYRIAYTSPACATAMLRAPAARKRTARPMLRLGCRGYTSFTPGRGHGGRYTIEVEASFKLGPQGYRLLAAPATADDIGVGLPLQDRRTARGTLSPSGIDVVDVYHFDVPRFAEARLQLRHAPGRDFDIVLLRDSGGRLGTSGDNLERRLAPGRYVVAVRGEVGSRGGRYRLSLLLRDVTSTSISIGGQRSAEVRPGTTVSVQVSVSPTPQGGSILVQIDRFDPLTGWHFHRMVRVSATAGSFSWRPPALGRWRFHASFQGTVRSSPSRSGYATVLVANPIG